MGQIAYLTGVPGSGKSTLANRFGLAGCAVIPGDYIAHFTSVRLCPFLNPGRTWHWDLWEALLTHCDVRSAMRRVLVDVCSITPAPNHETMWERALADRPVIVEAHLLGMAGFRRAFGEALRDAGCQFAGGGLFLLDVEPAAIVKHVQGRIESGDRPKERPLDEAKVKGMQRHLEGYLSGSEVVRRPDRDSMADTLRASLGISDHQWPGFAEP